jgi:hypothetical protein
MPYVPPSVRQELDSGRKPASCGELNYVITKLLIEYMHENPLSGYGTFNSAVGVLEMVKFELYRRMVAPYEDRKVLEHGEVYPVL